jgi:hypothetical protein
LLFRSTYSQELKKIRDSQNSGAGTDSVYSPSVVWFKTMDESLRNISSTMTLGLMTISCRMDRFKYTINVGKRIYYVQSHLKRKIYLQEFLENFSILKPYVFFGLTNMFYRMHNTLTLRSLIASTKEHFTHQCRCI